MSFLTPFRVAASQRPACLSEIVRGSGRVGSLDTNRDAARACRRQLEGQEIVNAESAGDPLPLLTMKLAAPLPVPGLLPRAELVERLIEAPERICLISAPAGWGKSSLLAAWAQAEDGRRPFAFLRLETGDDSGPIFWTYVLAALRTVYPGLLPHADEALRSPGMDPMRRIVPMVLNELTKFDDSMVLVLDDYHVITSKEIHASVAHFVDHLPPSLRLVIATRSDPPLPWGRLRASGGLLEIRARSLAFSDEEAAEFLGKRFGLVLDGPEIRVLCSRTEGWPAALQLVGLSLRGVDDRRAFVTRLGGDDRNLADYLIGEVLEGVATSCSAPRCSIS